MKYMIVEHLLDTWRKYNQNGWLFSLGIVLYYMAYLLIQRILLRRGREKGEKKWFAAYILRLFLIWIFAVYIFFVINLTLFSREIGSRGTVNLTLFSFLTGSMSGRVEALENLIMLMPCGIILPLLFGRCKKWRLGAFGGFIISLIIESIQFATGCGYFELDDILLNGVGFMIGYIVYLLITLLF